MKDVARMAGVSTSTVSHVINKDRFVSDAIREKVESAIKALNYAPSALARSLKINQTRTIGMLITASTNPFTLSWCVAWSAAASSVVIAWCYATPKG
jgi:LacI family transcriptional regulator